MIDLKVSSAPIPQTQKLAVTDTLKVILNPCGGHMAGPAKQAKVEQSLQRAGVNYHLEVTRQAGHAVELARRAALAGWPNVVAAGGDGTINEVVNGLMQAAGDEKVSTLGIIPLGTANDLAAALSLPLDPLAACRRLAAAQSRLIDVGQVNGHYFVNNSAVGLEPVVTLAYNRLRWIPGKLRYLAAALQGIAQARPWLMRVVWNNSMYEGPISLVSVGNSRRTGGMFYLTPGAVPDDGRLDFVFAGGLSKRQLLGLLPQTFSGNHIHHPQVVYRQTTALSITAMPPSPIQADGEIIDHGATSINYEIIPGKLRVLV